MPSPIKGQTMFARAPGRLVLVGALSSGVFVRRNDEAIRTAGIGPLPADEFTATLDTAEELEARWAWSDALDGYGAPRPPADRSGLSATHGH
jgi:hypothetical protein